MLPAQDLHVIGVEVFPGKGSLGNQKETGLINLIQHHVPRSEGKPDSASIAPSLALICSHSILGSGTERNAMYRLEEQFYQNLFCLVKTQDHTSIQKTPKHANLQPGTVLGSPLKI